MQNSLILKEHIASIFRVKKLAHQDTSVKAGGEQSSTCQTALMLVSWSAYPLILKMEGMFL
jgi:hypothetical protein